MPSVEYLRQGLIKEVLTGKVENPDTGEMVEVEKEVAKHPFEVRIGKWVEKDNVYHVHGFVKVTEFGEKLVAEKDAWSFLKDNYSLGEKMSESKMKEMIDGIKLVKNGDLKNILDIGNVEFEDFTVKSEEQGSIDFKLALPSAQVFDIDWLKVDFDPSRGGK